MHHIAYDGALAPAFEEAAALLRPGGALVRGRARVLAPAWAPA